MDDIRIGGVFYGLDIDKAMRKANKTIMDSTRKVFSDDECSIRTIETAIGLYEECLLKYLKLGGENE